MALAALCLCCHGRDTAIFNGKLTSDLNANGFTITNLPAGFFPPSGEPEFQAFTNSGGVVNGPAVHRSGEEWASVGALGVSGRRAYSATLDGIVYREYSFLWWELLKVGDVPMWARQESKPTYTAEEVGALPESTLIPRTASDVSAYSLSSGAALEGAVAAISSTQTVDHATISAWQSYWDGDDVRVTVTNYFGQLELPGLYLEQKMPADEDHDDAWFRVVWDERTRWNAFLAAFTTYTNDVRATLADKADRAWGFYDSHTGGYSPEGYTQVSSAKILISAGMAYQKHVVSEGAVWVLESNGLVTQTSGSGESGFFRVEDDDGNSLFEIKKGDRREVGATANSVSTSSVDGQTHMTVVYNVVSEEHPTLYTSHDLGSSFTAETDEGSLVSTSWSGSSGSWTCEFWYKSSVEDKSRLFAKAGYQVGGETMIKQSVPTELDSVLINGVRYYLGVDTISGKTVLTLRTTP